jgi:hypothetical protein
MAVWALAKVAAIAEIKTRQMGSCQGAESLVRFKVVPSCPVSRLGYGISVSKKPHSSIESRCEQIQEATTSTASELMKNIDKSRPRHTI